MPMIRRAQDAAAFDALVAPLLPRAFYPLSFSPLGAAYYEAGVGEGFEDDSFVLEQGGAIVLVCCNVQPGTMLARFGIPIEVIVGGTAGHTQQRKLLREAFGEIHRIGRARGARTASFRTAPCNDPAGMMAAMMLGARATPKQEFRINADLTLGEEALAADMRKGHRQQVKWGDKNLQIEVIGPAELTPAHTDTLRQMHAEVAGRVTRPQESWDATHALVAADEGFYVLASMNGELLGATIILDAADTACYASGIYRREHFDKPLAHACVYRAMMESAKRGRRNFEIGVVPHDGDEASDKEFAIGFFKHGFSSRVITSTLWTYLLDEPEA